MNATDQAPAATEADVAAVLLRHASCLDLVAADLTAIEGVKAAVRVAAYLRAEASLARTAARLIPTVIPETEETANADA